MARPAKNQDPKWGVPSNLTRELINGLKCPEGKGQVFKTDLKVPWLKVRLTRGGAKSFVFEARLNGETKRRTIGHVDAWSVDDARAKAIQYKRSIDEGVDPRSVELAKLAQAQHEREEKERIAKFTVQALLSAYADELEKRGSSEHNRVRGIFRLHLSDAHPELAGKPANGLTTEEATQLIRSVIAKGRTRTAGKLRSYARAAYELGKTVDENGTVPEEFKEFKIEKNPFAMTASIALQTDKNPLTASNMRSYWAAIKDDPTFQAAVLRFFFLTGGQRIEQMCKLKVADVHDDYFVIYERKGRGQKSPRSHIIPLIPAAAKALQEIRTLNPYRLRSKAPETTAKPGMYAITTDDGSTHISAEAISKWANNFGSEIGGFQAKRLRSGTETLLASKNINREQRGHLMSHGISGVQSASYDGWDYMDVKWDALETFYETLEAVDGRGSTSTKK